MNVQPSAMQMMMTKGWLAIQDLWLDSPKFQPLSDTDVATKQQREEFKLHAVFLSAKTAKRKWCATEIKILGISCFALLKKKDVYFHKHLWVLLRAAHPVALFSSSEIYNRSNYHMYVHTVSTLLPLKGKTGCMLSQAKIEFYSAIKCLLKVVFQNNRYHKFWNNLR